MANRVRARLPSQIRIALLCLIGVIMWAPVAPADSLSDFNGQRVSAIRVVGESGAVLEDNPTGLALEPGQPFSIDAERETLRQLYRSGRYADLVAEVSPEGGGLLLSFVAQQNYYVSRVLILGLREPPSDTQAVAALGFSLGTTFHESDMPAALTRLRSMLEDEGLHQAKISYQLSPHPDTRQMDITVRIVPGPRARVGALHLINETPYSEAELRGQLRLKPKTEVTSERLDQDTQRVQKWLAARGYLGARVSVSRGSYDAGTNQLPLEIHLFAGLKVEVRVAGANVSSRTLHRLLPIYEEGAVDDDLLQEGRRNLRDYFQGQGYFDTEVNYVTSETPSKATPGAGAAPASAASSFTAAPSAAPDSGSETITYQVERGPRRRLVGMSFTGNQYFDDEILRSRVRIQPAGFDRPAASVRRSWPATWGRSPTSTTPTVFFPCTSIATFRKTMAARAKLSSCVSKFRRGRRLASPT